MRYAALIDPDGFRPNVGIILSNEQRRLFWGRRIGQNAWQFPQGGIKSHETPMEAMYRELEEEVGLTAEHVTVLGCTQGWLRYRLPRRFIRRRCGPTCIGQKQVWFMLRIDCAESAFCLDRSAKPEFDAWRWVRYWHPLREVVYFKRHVYAQALEELAPLLYPEGAPLAQSPPDPAPVSHNDPAMTPAERSSPAGAQHEPQQRLSPAARLAGPMRQRRR
jgi:putative (di)nucleoside polyphosphate hydrolase